MVTQKNFSRKEILNLFSQYKTLRPDFAKEAVRIRQNVFSNGIYIRGLIEISSYCRCNCLYCGIRCGNNSAQRYRLTDSEIIECCSFGYQKGFRTFVLQGGEDLSFSDTRVAAIITEIKQRFPDCAVTLSLGQRDYATYRLWKQAGADRYLLRHEAAAPELFAKLHPENQKLEERKKCLFDLKELGYQVGSGFMVGAPFQTFDDLAEDLLFLQKLNPQMIGIGPFIPHPKTQFAKLDEAATSLYKERIDLTLFLISLLRILFPYALIPATTALNTLSKTGRTDGILAGANVIMPNLTPASTRKKYDLYEGKTDVGAESIENLELLNEEMKRIGYKLLLNDRGDFKMKLAGGCNEL